MKRYIGLIITMCLIYIGMNLVYKRGTASESQAHSSDHYIIRLPKIIKSIYMLLFIAGILLFLFFFVVKTKWGGGVTDGHLWFALILAGIGIVVMMFAVKWKIVVCDGKMTVYSLLGPSREYQIAEIDDVKENAEGKLVLYKDKSRIAAVESLSENYEYFRNTLEQYGKIK